MFESMCKSKELVGSKESRMKLLCLPQGRTLNYVWPHNLFITSPKQLNVSADSIIQLDVPVLFDFSGQL